MDKKGAGVSAAGKSDYVKWFSELSSKDVAIAGGKGASLAEMYNHKFPIPPGFIITAAAYRYFIETSGLIGQMKELLDDLDVEETDTLEANAKKMRELMVAADLPKDLEKEIVDAYDVLDVDRAAMSHARGTALDILRRGHEPPFVAVRSSATAEDLAEASFAGQQESFLNVKGHSELLRKVRECFASLFTARAVYYRAKNGFPNETTYLTVVIQKMVDSEKSGVMFTQNPVRKDNTIMIEAVWGLGEGIVSGMIKPDNYIVDGNIEKFKINELSVSEKKVAIVRNSAGKNEIVKLSGDKARRQVLTTGEIKTLATYGKRLEEHYKKPQDIEFAVEGGEVYIVQSRPITTLEKIDTSHRKEIAGKVLLSGLGASPGVASGVVKIVKDLKELDKVKKGDVLVTIMTNPDMVVTMQKAAAIVTDEGGITSHASIVSREMGIPCVVGTETATSTLKDGMVITVDGRVGKVYEGAGETQLAEVGRVVPTRTKIKVTVDLPEYAERAAKSGAHGVGLVRLEGIIASGGKHPLAFVKEKKIGDYVKLLYEGLRKIAAPFGEMWVRTSDIRSDEFVHLEGAPKHIEGNPMLGDHGIRFSLKHIGIMEAEIDALKKLALEFPNKKFGLMMPQVIALFEVEATKKLMEKAQMPANVILGIMVETPAAVQVINSLCEAGIKFISFGTNDLTQYTLAIDRNNAEVQNLYDEMNPAVLNSLSYVIRRCKRYGVESSICGQAGSREDMVEFLVKEGIDSISVNADAAEKISKLVSELESKGFGPKDASSELPIRTPPKKENKDKKQASGKSFGDALADTSIEVAKTIVSVITDPISEDIEDVILKELDSIKGISPGQNVSIDSVQASQVSQTSQVSQAQAVQVQATPIVVPSYPVAINSDSSKMEKIFDSSKAVEVVASIAAPVAIAAPIANVEPELRAPELPSPPAGPGSLDMPVSPSSEPQVEPEIKIEAPVEAKVEAKIEQAVVEIKAAEEKAVAEMREIASKAEAWKGTTKHMGDILNEVAEEHQVEKLIEEGVIEEKGDEVDRAVSSGVSEPALEGPSSVNNAELAEDEVSTLF